MTPFRFISALLLSLIFPLGCGSESDMTDPDLTRAYGEILIAESQYGSDTSTWGPEIREILDETGFGSIAEVRQRFERLAIDNPQGVTPQIDSVQRWLERERDGGRPGSDSGGL